MTTIKKTDFAKHIHKKFGFSNAMSEQLIDIIFGEMTQTLTRGRRIQITNFGAFNINHKRERMGRNPKTGKAATISARRVPTFKPSAEFRDILKGK